MKDIKNMIGILALAVLFVFTACEGPTGPKGDPGLDVLTTIPAALAGKTFTRASGETTTLTTTLTTIDYRGSSCKMIYGVEDSGVTPLGKLYVIHTYNTSDGAPYIFYLYHNGAQLKIVEFSPGNGVKSTVYTIS